MAPCSLLLLLLTKLPMNNQHLTRLLFFYDQFTAIRSFIDNNRLSILFVCIKFWQDFVKIILIINVVLPFALNLSFIYKKNSVLAPAICLVIIVSIMRRLKIMLKLTTLLLVKLLTALIMWFIMKFLAKSMTMLKMSVIIQTLLTFMLILTESIAVKNERLYYIKSNRQFCYL